jgi:hypothetical protein
MLDRTCVFLVCCDLVRWSISVISMDNYNLYNLIIIITLRCEINHANLDYGAA